MSDFNFVDRILEISEKTILARKNLTINEDYLLDHFSGFPVMPGVLMTQSLVETAGWWLKHKTNFKAANIQLKQVKNARFANFLKPGDNLRIEVQNKDLGENTASFQAKGKCEEKVVLSVQFTLNYDQFRDKVSKEDAAFYINQEKEQFKLLFRQPR